jgi:cell division protein FtsZ
MDEITEIMDFIQNCTTIQSDIIWGNTYDDSLGNALSVTIVATGLESEVGLGVLKPDLEHKTLQSEYDYKCQHLPDGLFGPMQKPEDVEMEVEGEVKVAAEPEMAVEAAPSKRGKKIRMPKAPHRPSAITKLMDSLFDDEDDKLI